MKYMEEIELNELIKVAKRRERDNEMIELTDYKFEYYNLSNKNISNMRFIGCDFSSSFLNKTKFNNCEFLSANFTHAILYNTKFIKSKIFLGSFHCAILDHSIFKDTTINHCIITCSAGEFAKFRNCNLFDTSFGSSNLRHSEFSDTSLRRIHFTSSNLTSAIFIKCFTEKIDFDWSNLSGTDLDGLNGFQNEYVRGKILTENIIGYKASTEGYIIVLEIPAGAIVFSINGNKYRTNKAKVIDIYDPMIVSYKITRAHSMFDKRFSYYIGDEFNIKDFDLQYNNECSTGIHFFTDKEKVIEYLKD